MKRWLQEFSFKKSFYERPNQKWICGRACEGKACLAGPNARGNCTATAECRPLRKGDRWYCTRPAAFGGPCPEGPSPDGACCRPIPKCTPIRSLRSLRGLAVLITVALTLSVLCLLMGSERGAKVLMPGELNFAHGSPQFKCSDCHAGAEGRPFMWLVNNPNSPAAHADSIGCLKCHNLGESPMLAHSLPQPQLQELTQVILKADGGSRPTLISKLDTLVAGKHSSNTQMTCATCHKEHRGRKSDLKNLSNAQCQSCHAVQFASFSNGHPAFKKFPFERRTRINFDHYSHLRQHFLDAAVSQFAPKVCSDCHQADLKSGAMLVKSFEVTCAACHGEQIRGKGAVNTGIAFLSLPRFDDRTLAGPYAIGEWPEDADQGITPFMRLMLSSNPDLRTALDTLKGVDLSNLPKNHPDQIKAAQQLAWGIKGLIYDLETHGQNELTGRISKSLGRPLTSQEDETVVSLLGSEVIKAAFTPTFPDLEKEVLAYRGKQKPAPTNLTPSPPPAAPGLRKVAAPDEWVDNGGWFSPDASFTVFYRPTGHADAFLTTWMNLTVDAGQTPDPTAAAAIFKNLASPQSAGLCMKCHSIDSAPRNLVNWNTAQPDPFEHQFNQFSHTTHLSLIGKQGCFTCHLMKENESATAYAASFAPGQRDPTKFSGNFREINKQVCAECHKPNFVREDCLLCHNYHIGRFKNVSPHTVMKTLALLNGVAGK